MSSEDPTKLKSEISDSDDDKPLAALILKRKSLQQLNPSADNQSKRVKPESTTASSKIKVKEEKGNGKVETDVKIEKETKTKSSSSSSASRKSAEFYETQKGDMVQKLLCRWWYAIQWPKPEDIGQPPDGYESLDGFVGVYISTRSDSLGNIVDLRDKDTCPNLKNLSKWPSAKIQQTLVEAYEKQMEVLKEHEGDDTSLYRTLRNELKTIKAINTGKADQEAKKFSF